MAFHLDQNPLEQNPLFAGVPQQGSPGTAAKKPAAEQPEQKAVKAAKPRTAQPDGSEAYQRATFIVRRDLLARLKDYAYTERRELKEIINTILESALDEIAAEYEKDGRSFVPHK